MTTACSRAQKPLTQNPYLYASDSPISRTDSTGRDDLFDSFGTFTDLSTLTYELMYGDDETAFYMSVGIAAGLPTAEACSPLAAAGPVGRASCGVASVAVGAFAAWSVDDMASSSFFSLLPAWHGVLVQVRATPRVSRKIRPS